MDLGVSEKVAGLIEKVRDMIENEIAPLNSEYFAEIGKHPSKDRFAMTDRQIEIMDGLKAKAQARGLWNFWLTDSERDYSYYNINLGYNVLPGEAFLTENYAFNTNFYLIAGAGATEFAGDTRFTLNAGAGYQVLLTDSVSVHFGVRQHFYDIDVLGEEKTSVNTEVSTGLSVFF